METTLPFPPAATYRVLPISSDGVQDRGVGRRFVSFDGAQARVHARRRDGEVILEMTVVSVVQTANKIWELTAAAGEVWRLQGGCSCVGG